MRRRVGLAKARKWSGSSLRGFWTNIKVALYASLKHKDSFMYEDPGVAGNGRRLARPVDQVQELRPGARIAAEGAEHAGRDHPPARRLHAVAIGQLAHRPRYPLWGRRQALATWVLPELDQQRLDELGDRIALFGLCLHHVQILTQLCWWMRLLPLRFCRRSGISSGKTRTRGFEPRPSPRRRGRSRFSGRTSSPCSGLRT